METIIVTNMRCVRCRERIEKGLLEAGISADVELETKSVTVKPEDREQTIRVLTELGYETKES